MDKFSGTKSINIENDIYSHAATLSFWAFVEDNTAFGDDTVSVGFENRVKIWLGVKGGNKIASWCIPRPDFYPNIPGLTVKDLQSITKKADLETQKTDTEKNVLFKELPANSDGLWFNVKCAYTLTDKKTFLALHKKDTTSILKDGPKAMKWHNYKETEQIDFPFRDFNTPNRINFQSGVSGKSILVKAVTAFVDYFPDSVYYEYFRLQKDSNSYLSSLVFYSEMLGDWSSNTLQIKYLKCKPGTQNCSTESTTNITMSSNSLKVPKGFYSLNLLDRNKYFSYPDLNPAYLGSMTCPGGACFKNSKFYSCPNKQYLADDKGTCKAKCDSAKDPSRQINLTSNYNGNCFQKCDTAVKCLGSQSLNVNSNFACKSTYTSSYFFCFKDTDNDKGAIHYGSYLNPPKIEIPVSPALDNYHLEIWYFPDVRFITSANTSNMYFLQTNSWSCKKGQQNASTNNDYACYQGNTKIGNDVTMKYLNWQRLAFSVTGSGSNYNFSFHFNKYNAGTSNKTVNASLNLNKIIFCTNQSGCLNQNWNSGFYKWLKIYDAKYLSTDVFKAKDVV